jgi:hypothetical protein
MTLIASIELDGVGPIILGDILLSVPRIFDPGTSLSTPLRHDVKTAIPASSETVAVDYTQKVILIGPRICVAWTGNMLVCRAFLADLRELEAKNPDLTYLDLVAHYERTGFPHPDDLGVIVYIRSGNGFGHHSNLPVFPVGSIERVRIGGSGTEHFFNTLETIAAIKTFGNTHAYQDAWIKMLAYMGSAAAAQTWLGTGLTEGFGGAFELVTFDGSNFRKHGPLLWLWCSFVRVDEKYELHVLHPFVFQYSDDGETCFIFDDGKQTRVYWMSPPDRRNGSAIPDHPNNLKAHTVICCVRAEDGQQVHYGAFVDEKRLDLDSAVEIVLRGDKGTTIQMADELIERLLKFAPGGRRVDVLNVWGASRSC